MKTRLLIIAVLICMVIAYVLSGEIFVAAVYFKLLSSEHGVGYVIHFFYEPLFWLEGVLAKILYHH